MIEKIIDNKIALFTVVRSTDAEKESLLKNKKIVGYIQKPFEIKNLIKEINKIVK